jgi:hypothetical protein
VRNTFSKSLPHPSTIHKWYLTVNAGPGFTQEVHWSGKRFCGYVDLGMSSEDANFDNSELAKDDVVFTATAITGKLPRRLFLD